MSREQPDVVLRFRECIKETSKTRAAFARLLGVDRWWVENCATGLFVNSNNSVVFKKRIDIEVAKVLEQKAGISSAWLLTGHGSMYDIEASPLAKSLGDNSTSRLHVPFYSDIIYCQKAGFKAAADIEVQMISLPRTVMDQNIKKGAISAIRVEDDIIFIKHQISQNITNKKPYLFAIDQKLQFKNISYMRVEDKFIIENNDTAKTSFEAPASSVQIIAKAISIMKNLI